MRRSPSPIPPSLYKHFAVATLAVTTALAMFADGENRQARASQIEAPAPAAEQPPEEFVRAPEPPRKSRASSQWYSASAFAGTFGQPMNQAFGLAETGIIPGEAEMTGREEPAGQVGLTQTDRELLLRQLRESRAVQPGTS